MPEYVPEDVKRSVRCEALERAVQSSTGTGWTMDTLIEVADMFENYLLNGKQEPAVQTEPEPGNPRKSV